MVREVNGGYNVLRVPATIILLGGILASALLALTLSPVADGGLGIADAHWSFHGRYTPGRYIVVLRNGADPAAYARQGRDNHGFRVDTLYRHAFRGFAGRFSERALSDLQADPNVILMEPDRRVKALPQTLPTGIDRVDADGN